MSGRSLARIGLFIGLAALLIQFTATVPRAIENGRSLGGAVLFYFSFFTILTNILAVLVYAAYLRGWSTVLATSSMRACAAASITLVMIVYITMLAGLYAPRGLFLTADMLLHYVCPPIYILWWVMAGADGKTRIRDLARWVLYPLSYFAVLCIRWLFVGEMPYPFIDPAEGGWRHVGNGVLTMSVFFGLIGLGFIAADHLIGRLRR